MKSFMQKHVKKAVAAGAAIYGTVASAAATVPATAAADLDTSVTSGGDLAIGAVLGVVGFGVILRMMKKI